MPVISVGWTEIKERLGDTTALYALTHRQASLLLSLSEQLTWDKTFRTDTYDPDDKDEIDIDVADLQRNLTMPTNLSDLIPLIDDVETLLETLVRIANNQPQPCCSGGSTSQFGEELPPNTNYPDTPPATWGEETVADSDDWQELVCGAAHDYVDVLKLTGNQMGDALEDGIIVLAIVAGGLAVLASAGWLLPVAYTAAAGITTALVAGATAATFAGVDDDLEAAREDIVCAIVHGEPQDIEDAIEDAVGAVAWTLFFSYKDYASHQAAMQNGQVGDQALTVNRRTDCDCVPEWACASGVLMDCGFESHTLDYWKQQSNAVLTWMTDAHSGTYSCKTNGSAGWSNRDVYQEFTPTSTTANIRLFYWAKWLTGSYGAAVYVERWNGSTWVEELSKAAAWTPSWTQYNTAGSMTLTAGVLYRIRIFQGAYHLIDDVDLVVV